jgi:hypothetical protein
MPVTPDPIAVAAEPVSAPDRSGRADLRRTTICLGISVGGLFLLWAVLQMKESGPVAAVALTGVAIVSIVGTWFAGATIFRAFTANPPRGLVVLGGLILLAVHGAMVFLGAVVALLSSAGGRGRQLRRFGRVLLPRLRPGSDWSGGFDAIAIEDAARTGLATQWRENARTEHASVGAFAVLTMDLLALGAPPELLASAHRDGLDEIRHAQMCLGLATAIDGVDLSPAPFPESRSARALPRTRVLALARLAVDSLVDGVLHEGLSARTLARLARLAESTVIRETLTVLAADEGRHAAHAWHVVQWCVREGGEPVVQALRGAARVLPRRPGERLRDRAGERPSSRPDDSSSLEARDGAWQRWGIPGRALEEEEYAAAVASVARRVEALVASDAQAPTRVA